MNSQHNPLCPADQQYTPPAGTSDRPYIYVYNYEQPVVNPVPVDPLAGQNLSNLQVQLKGDSEFILRKMLHYSRASGFRPYTPQGNYMFSTPVLAQQAVALAGGQWNWAVVPEMKFPPAGALAFDVTNWSSNDLPCAPNGGSHLYHTQFLFQGVRRFQGGGIYPRESTYRYKEVPYSYQYPFPLPQPYFVFQPAFGNPYVNLIKSADLTDQSVVVNDYDFELLAVTIAIASTPATLVGGVVGFKILLYGPDERALSSDFVYAGSVNFYESTIDADVPSFPVPPVLYPVGSQIRFDIRSMQTDTNLDGIGDITSPFVVYFRGIRRVRC